MVRGFYIAATGMMVQRRNMEIVTHNITNADTIGYKKEIMGIHSFDSELVRRLNDYGVPVRSTGTGPLNFGAQVDFNFVDFSTGGFEETGRATDLAIAGDAFFAVETPQGTRYTKCGAFYLNGDGYLTDGDGNFLLGENGRVFVGGGDFAVGEDGSVTVNGAVVNKIRAVSFADNIALRQQGDNLYFAGAQPLAEPKEFAILQGFVENSNVDVGREMVDMITVYRTYETNQRMLTMIDETVGKAVTEIGRLR
ncbi:MAG: flagellar hook-basal body protein [Oscillospiraceae bacterium]|jgi:flagellar basal-body rod protein FlgG|nr:flagellar hook-basal body protein [Oscillospiraceae bacterium]